MEEKYLYVSKDDVNKIVKEEGLDLVLNSINDALVLLEEGKADQPDKISQVFDQKTQNRINCMTATIKDLSISGMKWVSVFPTNAPQKIRTIEGVSIISELETGKLKCVMNSTECTSLRTAAVGAVAALYLARKNSKSIGFIGAGEEAKAHFKLIKHVLPQLEECYFSSRTESRITELIKELSVQYPDIKFLNCGNNYEDSIRNSDVIVTAISSQEQILKSEWIKKGSLYIHVAGLEDEFSVAEMADKIVCDSWEAVKHRTQTISQMYKLGKLKDDDIYGDIAEIILGNKKARESDDEFIYFNSVGLAAEDVLLCERIYQKAIEKNIGTWVTK